MHHPCRFLVPAAAAALLLFSGPAFAQRLRAERVVTGLSGPTFITNAGDASGRLFITEQNTARIRVVDGGALLAAPFLDLGPLASAGGERGLLGLAFHPDYAANGRFYVDYTNNAGNTVVAEYTATPPSSNTADPGSARILLTIAQPFSNHNGGWLAFGPLDGFLYIATGDGGSGGDPGNRAQDTTSQLLGKLLRIDVDGDDFPADPARNYAIPVSNPFVGASGDDEIWAYGLRNPWRNDFDDLTGDLYVGDVGQNQWEEIDFEPAGSGGGVNYGWRLKEGTHCFNPGVNCDPGGITTDPVHEYNHGGSPFRCSVTGGVLYRGSEIPGLQGTYFFGDFCSRQIWSFRWDGTAVTQFTDRTAELVPPAGGIASISSFGEDEEGEIYICDLSGGEIFRILSDQMELAVPQMTGGQPVTMDVSGAGAGMNVFFIASRAGLGLTPVPDLRGTLFLDTPFLIGAARADGAGNSSLSLNLPFNASGRTVWVQAAEKGNTSDVESQTIN